jgi:hypothetical protein
VVTDRAGTGSIGDVTSPAAPAEPAGPDQTAAAATHLELSSPQSSGVPGLGEPSTHDALTVPSIPSITVPVAPDRRVALPEPEPDRRYAHAPGHIRPMGSKRAALTTIIVGVLALGVCLGALVFSGLFGNVFGKTAEPTASATDSATTEPTLVASHATSFDDGQWLVGTDIMPGVYAVDVPAASDGCNWERDSSSDGTANSVLEAGVGTPGQHLAVTIKDTDAVFQSHDCGTWKRIG